MQSMHQVDGFDLPDRIRNIIYYGISGGYVTKSTHTKQLCAKVKNSRPEIVVLQIERNDLDSIDLYIDFCVKIDLRLHLLAQILRRRYGVQKLLCWSFTT